MSLSGEQRPIDVTVLPPRQEQPPTTGKAAWQPGVAFPDVGEWLERPRVRVVLFTLLASLAVGVVIARVRPPTVDGPVLPRAGWRAVASGMAKPGRMASSPGATPDTVGATLPGGWMYINSMSKNPGTLSSFAPARGGLYPYVKNTTVYTCPDDTQG